MNILIVKLSAIGDVIHTLPSLSALRELYPEAHITWVVEEGAVDIIHDHPALDHVIVSRRKQWIAQLISAQNMKRTFREIRSFAADLRSRHYDLIIDFHGLFKSAVLVGLCRGRRKLGYDSMQELSGLFLNEKITEDMSKHAVQRYLDFIRYLGGHPETPDFFVAINPENVRYVKTLLDAHGLTGQEKITIVSPTALWETKLWDNDHWAMLCDRIVRETDSKVIFTGAPGDRAVQDICSRMKEESYDFSGKTSLKDLACLYRQAAVVITTDSGPMHLATAVKAPVVALFGPTSPERTGPYGSEHTVIRTGITCSPCLKKQCELKTCMNDISAEEVFIAVQTKLALKGEK